MDEVEKALARIRKGKASGIDGIPIELYSSDIKYFTPLLTTLFNTIFDSADYPDFADYLGTRVDIPSSQKGWYVRSTELSESFSDSLSCKSF